jgi:hypothetical protein
MKEEPQEVPEEMSPGMREKINLALQEWLMKEIHGSPLSQHTESWNTLYHALPSLAQRIMQVIEEE